MHTNLFLLSPVRDLNPLGKFPPFDSLCRLNVLFYQITFYVSCHFLEWLAQWTNAKTKMSLSISLDRNKQRTRTYSS